MDVVTYKVGEFIDSKSHPMRGISCHEKSYNYVNLISKCDYDLCITQSFKLTNPKQFNWGTCLASNTKSQKQLMRIGKCDCLKKKGKKKKPNKKNRNLYFF